MFKRLLNFNRPKINVVIGILFSIIHGSIMPVFGGIMAKMLFVLMDTRDLTALRDNATFWCCLMIGLALSVFFSGFINKFIFGVIGENVTLNIRRSAYRKIIEKHLGWFDNRENAPGILTSSLASDA